MKSEEPHHKRAILFKTQKVMATKMKRQNIRNWIRSRALKENKSVPDFSDPAWLDDSPAFVFPARVPVMVRDELDCGQG